MGHRLSKIYTRTGDGGETGLGDGARTRKDSPRVVALGEIDELNSAIGVLLAEAIPEKTRSALENIQHDLFDLGGDVSIPGRATMTEGQVQRLERLLDGFNSALPPLKEFILPGGTRAAGLPESAIGPALRSRPRPQPRGRPRRRAVAAGQEPLGTYPGAGFKPRRKL